MFKIKKFTLYSATNYIIIIICTTLFNSIQIDLFDKVDSSKLYTGNTVQKKDFTLRLFVRNSISIICNNVKFKGCVVCVVCRNKR